MEGFLTQYFPNQSWLGYIYANNTLEAYIIFLITFLILLFVLRLFRVFIFYRLTRLAEHTKTDVDDIAIRVIKTLKPPFYAFIAFYIAIQYLTLNLLLTNIITMILMVWIVYQGVTALSLVTEIVIHKRAERNKETRAQFEILNKTIKIVIWSIALLFVLSNFGINITSLIAGLGIGGIAIAFALQNILADLFSSFAIYFDKPFEVGDFIIVGDKTGIVERIGIKTTRVRSLQGEEIVFANQELTTAQIQNFKKMRERRISFQIGVTYDTKNKAMEEIPIVIESIIRKISNIRFDRAHFTSFGDSALMFEVVYYINSADYAEYMNAQQEINLKIKKEFEARKIEFAYPTQTIFLQK